MNFKTKLTKLFISYLHNDLKIDYCILGNHEGLFKKRNKDLDLYINFKNRKNLLKILKPFLKNKKLLLVNLIEYEHNSFQACIVKIKSNNFNYLILDICNDFTYDNRLFLRFNNIQKKIVKINNFKLKILPNYYIFKYYFNKKILKLKNDKIFINNSDIKFLINILKNCNYKNLMDKHIYNYSKILKFLLSIKKNKTNKKNLLKYYNSFFYSKKFSFFKFYNKLVNRLNFITGIQVVFLGCDGSGKSSIIKNISKSIILNFFRHKFFHYHLFSKYQTRKQTLPYKKKEYNQFLSNVKLLYLYIRFVFNYYFNIYIKKIKSNLILNDRYYHDVFIDPKRYRIKSNLILNNLFPKILPKVDIIFYINTSAENIYKRKKELPLPQIKKIIKMYKDNLSKCNNLKVINNNTSSNVTSFNVCKEILLYKNNKLLGG